MGLTELDMAGRVDLSGAGRPHAGSDHLGSDHFSGSSAAGGGLGGGFGGAVAQAALSDPGVQDKLKQAAYQQAEQGFHVARHGAAQAMAELKKYVQEGPAGISVLCFLGGIATTVSGIFGILSVTDGLTNPFHYVLNIYLTVFGIVTFLLEADFESLKSFRVLGRLAPLVERYQMEVFNRANFLTELRGRGFFYLFVGALAITQCLVCLLFLVGVWNLLMGVLCLMMSFGINPADHMSVPLNQPHAGDSGHP